MEYILMYFFNLSVSIRASIILFFFWVIWCLTGKFLFKIFSLLPLVLKTLVLLIHRIIELPITILHKTLGKAFAGIDHSLSVGFAQIYYQIDQIYRKFRNSSTVYAGKLFVVLIIVIAILIISDFAKYDKIKDMWEYIYLRLENALFKQHLG